MKNVILLIIYLTISSLAIAQTTLRGRITDAKGEPIIGANVFLKNTFDGTSSDTTGTFQFSTTEPSQDTLVISAIGYYTIQQKIDLKNTNPLIFKLKEEATELNTVVITAGSFEASDAKRVTILKPLDIVRTASANGDIFGAIQTLPGASRVGEQEGLFVRGGSANESKTIIDGMVVQNPFFSSVPQVSQRGRFNPFLFKGTAFSTGGYSAQYGQALSSVLALQSQDLAEETNLNIFASFLTGAIQGTKKWKNTSLSLSGSYTNLGLAFKIIPQNVEWTKPVIGFGNSLIFRHKFGKNDLLKLYSNFGHSNLGMNFQDFENRLTGYQMKNDNVYNNLTYQNSFGKWTLQSGFSYSFNQDKIRLNDDKIRRMDDRWQGRLVLNKEIFKKSTLLFGGEVHQFQYHNDFNAYLANYTELYAAGFVEAEIYITRKLAGRVGTRVESSRLLAKSNLAPRFSMAYKTGEFSQISLAYGSFYQNPDAKYLYFNRGLGFEKSTHYIFNYQWMKNDRTFRTEIYHKDYQSLAREMADIFNPDPFRLPFGNINNSGKGFASGFDIFWRDKKTLKNIDYWVSYSFLDTKRLFENYTQSAVPNFASKHNLSVVYKHYIAKINLDINFTYSYASGRTYFNPNSDKFMQDLTPDFHNMSAGVNYIGSLAGNQMILIFSVDNILGLQNIFGYRYSADGSQRTPINPPAYRSFFLGMSLTIK
jgi:hypothetical protein